MIRYGGRASQASIEEFGEDYCKRVAESIMESLQRFCTPIGQNMDAAAYSHLQEIIRCFTSDGCPAALKAGRFLAQQLPNLTVIHRDTSHAIRLLGFYYYNVKSVKRRFYIEFSR